MSDFVRYYAWTRPDEIALDDLASGAVLTWRDLHRRVDALAAVLSTRYSVGYGDRVAFLAGDRPVTFEILFACARLGAIFVPFNRRLSLAELRVLYADADPAVFLYDGEWAEAARDLAHASQCRLVDLDTDLVAGPATATGPEAAAGPRAAAPGYASDHPLMLLYTSGTTGLPKGAVVTQATMLAQTLNTVDVLSLRGPGDRYLSVLPLFHAAGLLSIALPLLVRGGRVSVAPRFDPGQAAAWLCDQQAGFTHLSAAPIMYQLIADAAGPDASFSHLQHGLVGGGHLTAELNQWFIGHGWELQVGWGATEMGPSTTVMPLGCSVSKYGSVGQLVPNMELRVVGTDGRDVLPGEEGEAWVSGPNIAPAYWRRPPEHDETYVGGWLRSGDAVRIDADGFVWFCGRYKDMYKSGGENVFAAEVERVLMDHPALSEVAVLGIPDAKWGETGMAVVVAPGTAVTAEEIQAHCRAQLAGYKVPTRVEFVDNLPRNVTGKVQKSDLRRQFGGVRAFE